MDIEKKHPEYQHPASEIAPTHPEPEPAEAPAPTESTPRPQPAEKVLTTISNILSAVFSPLLVPTYGYLIVMWTSYLALYPERARFLSGAVIFVITAIVPLSVIMFMMRRGIISDAAINNPRERGIPYVVTIVCYLAAALCLRHLPTWLYMFFCGAAAAAMIDLIVNLRWKISAHATALGGLCAVIFFIGIKGIAIVLVLPWLTGAILLSGMVGAARVYLGRHTPGQVYAGWVVGASMSLLFMLL